MHDGSMCGVNINGACIIAHICRCANICVGETLSHNRTMSMLMQGFIIQHSRRHVVELDANLSPKDILQV